MSIHAAIKRHIKNERLFALQMTFSSDTISRCVFLSEELRDLLEEQHTARESAFRIGRLQADLEAFAKGEIVSFCFVPFEAGDAFFGKLHRVEEEIWDVRNRNPKPGIRLFGRFAAQNVFIASTWFPRSQSWNGKQPLGRRNNPLWEQAKDLTRKHWNTLFPDHHPLQGTHPDEYVSENGLLV